MQAKISQNRISVRLGILLILPLLANPLWAAGWQLLPDESWFKFEVRAENTPVEGEFRQFSVALEFDAGQPELASLKVGVNIAGADLQDEDINAAIAGSDWFSIADFPRATYVSEKINLAGAGYRSRGALEVKGRKQKVSFPFTWDEAGSTATMTGEFILFRTDFDVGTGEWSGNEPISTDVRLWFNIGLKKNE